jgi:isoleucyl-tRNA synthetase
MHPAAALARDGRRHLQGELLAELQESGKARIEVEGETLELDNEDIQVRLQAKPGWAAAQGPHCVVVLNTEITGELLREGYIRDLVRLVQDCRKEMDLQYTDRIEVAIVTDSDQLQIAIQENLDFIRQETLAVSVLDAPIQGVTGNDQQIATADIKLFVRKAEGSQAV